MPVREILLLGDERLYEPSTAVELEDLEGLRSAIEDLHDTMAAFQAEHGWGRAISAPQIGVRKRFIATLMDGERRTYFNPVLKPLGPKRICYWEDCMSFPELLVRLEAPARSQLRYRDESWRERVLIAEQDFAGLFHHEVDHLDGVLAVQRALDDRSVALRRARPPKDPTLRGAMTLVE